ncbi:hypothetical protein EG329_012714 [Mollisiaceae sp. DMI_Dod_QoI]|nr:hypothetical protein EG329_012714 [Helotiales sp. DMI_Dod_QoI]
MAASHETIQQEGNLAQGRKLQVDFQWKKFKTLISEENAGKAKPLYIVQYRVSKPCLVFKTPANDSVIGTGTTHAISIDADCEIRGKPTKIKALKRFKTEYTYLSSAFSGTDAPVTMTWTANYGLKTWDFVCLDMKQVSVARFSVNVWGIKRIGDVEFLGSKATNEAAREEIVITGLTLFYCMYIRIFSVLSLFGAVLARPGPVDQEKPTAVKK